MAKLLVSVRSAAEAEAAVLGGASVIDVKEPARGPLGRADHDVWRAVRAVVPARLPVSVALGELNEWLDREHSPGARDEISVPWSGIAFRKLGLARAKPGWRAQWREVRGAPGDDRSEGSSPESAWVAVVYLDHETAGAPDPRSVLRAALEPPACAGALFDTWDKSRRPTWDPRWDRLVRTARESGLFVAIAGSLDEASIRNLQRLQPDLFAARGAACEGGDRRAAVERHRVARLVDAARGA